MDSVYSINIERAVLSSILFNPEEIEDVLGVLKSNHLPLKDIEDKSEPNNIFIGKLPSNIKYFGLINSISL